MDLKSNLTLNRLTDLDNSDSLSGFIDEKGRGWVAQQSHMAYDIFYDFICEVKPKRVLEIGTGEGALIYLINKICKDQNIECNVRTYDIYKRLSYGALIDAGIDQRIENIFNDNYSSVINPEVIEFVQSEGTTIVLCDGGFKTGEFQIFSEFIKPNDFILAHDYAYDKETFERDVNFKIWNWCEITDKDISESCNKYNLIPYQDDKFNSCAWVCKQKQG